MTRKAVKVVVKHRGSDTEQYMEYLTNMDDGLLRRYGEMGVAKLSAATPSKSGDTKNKWSYTIEKSAKGSKIIFCNENSKIVIWAQYGHAGPSGSWVQGNDFVNPAVDEVCKALAAELSAELSKI